MTHELSQVDLEALSAWMDGELEDTDAHGVSDRVRQDPAWKQAHEELLALDRLLNQWNVPPAAADLPGRVTASANTLARPRTLVFRVLAGAGALAAAAAVLMAIVLTATKPKTGPIAGNPVGSDSKIVRTILDGIPTRDQVLVENLDFLQDYDVVANFETLQALEQADEAEAKPDAL